MTDPLLHSLRAALADAGDPATAAGQQKYMKSSMPFHGVSAVPLRKICRQVLAAADLSTFERWTEQVLALWRGAQFREEWYGAVELVADARARTYHGARAVPMYEEMIVGAAWWDVVDAMSTWFGAALRAEPQAMRRVARQWSRSDNIWKRRTSIICQRGFKQATDVELLYACIEPSLDAREFFLRKGIGWALRSLAWTDAEEVRRYVAEQGPRLSPLSRREALKNVGG